MKWWEWLLIALWPSSLGIAVILGWVRGYKSGESDAYEVMARRVTDSLRS